MRGWQDGWVSDPAAVQGERSVYQPQSNQCATIHHHQISLETERLGPRRVEGLRREDEEWQKKAHAAVLSIQELTVKFFETTTRAQKGKKNNISSRSLLFSALTL